MRKGRNSTSEIDRTTSRQRGVVVVAIAALLGAVVLAGPATIWLVVAAVAAVAALVATWSIARTGKSSGQPGAPDVDTVASSQQVDEQAAGRDAEAVSSFVVSLARRNGGLVDQQLALLDTLELSVEDPELLANYFKLDHLATRMRRNADSLLVLAGVDRPRMRAPQDIDEVVRAGISEIEDYRRIDVLALDDVQVTGLAATTLGHLVAELLDNATAFSPSEARVRIAGNSAPAGYEILIADSGFGMSEARIDELNRKLALPPEFGAVGDGAIGLTVVSMLAARIGATVRLSNSEHGGTVATVHIPSEVLHLGDAPTPAFSMTSLVAEPAPPPVAANLDVEPSPLSMPSLLPERNTPSPASLVAEPSLAPMSGPAVEASPYVEAAPAVTPSPSLQIPSVQIPAVRPPEVAAEPASAAATTTAPAPSSIAVEAANAIARLTLTVSGLPVRPTATTDATDTTPDRLAATDSAMVFWPPPVAAADDGAAAPPSALSNALNSLQIVEPTESRPVVEARPDRIGAAMSSFARQRDEVPGDLDRTSY